VLGGKKETCHQKTATKFPKANDKDEDRLKYRKDDRKKQNQKSTKEGKKDSALCLMGKTRGLKEGTSGKELRKGHAWT